MVFRLENLAMVKTNVAIILIVLAIAVSLGAYAIIEGGVADE